MNTHVMVHIHGMVSYGVFHVMIYYGSYTLNTHY